MFSHHKHPFSHQKHRFPIKNTRFPIKNTHFPIKKHQFSYQNPLKNTLFPIKNTDFPIKNPPQTRAYGVLLRLPPPQLKDACMRLGSRVRELKRFAEGERISDETRKALGMD
jgi:hypothetical protein